MINLVIYLVHNLQMKCRTTGYLLEYKAQ